MALYPSFSSIDFNRQSPPSYFPMSKIKNGHKIRPVYLQRKRLRIALLCGKMIVKLLRMRTFYEKSNPNAIF